MLVVALAVLAGATLQSALGFGFALVASPALLLVLEPPQALTVLLLLGPPVNLVIALGERRRWHVHRRLVGVLLLGAAPGLVGGALLLPSLGRAPVQIAVGLLVLGAVAVQLRRPVTDPVETSRVPALATAAVGLLTGLLTTSTGTNGPPLVLWFTHLRLRPAELRDTLFVTFTALGVAGIAALVLSGAWAPQGVGTPGLLLLVALVLAGRVAGWRVFRRLPADRFRAAGLALVCVLGLVSLASGLSGAV